MSEVEGLLVHFFNFDKREVTLGNRQRLGFRSVVTNEDFFLEFQDRNDNIEKTLAV